MGNLIKGSKSSSLVRIPNGVAIEKVKPFSDKNLPDGRKVFKRIHGVSSSVYDIMAPIEFIIPYNTCKITGVEVIAAMHGDNVNLKIYDTPDGMIQQLFYGIAPENVEPNKFLNQFGFNTNLAKDFHRETSNYDADLIKDMKIVVEYNPKNTGSSRDVYINFILHEIKD